MATAYVRAVVASTAKGHGGRPLVLVQPAVSTDSLTGGVLIAYDATQSMDVIRQCLKQALHDFFGIM